MKQPPDPPIRGRSTEPTTTKGKTVAASPFRDALENGDLGAGLAMLDPDVVFHSPVLRKPFSGADRVAPLLELLWNTWADFRYTASAGSPDDGLEVLVFDGRMLDQEAQGVNLISWSDDRIVEFTVMVRPFRAAEAIMRALQLDPARA